MIPLIIKDTYIASHITPVSNIAIMVVSGIYQKLGADRLELMRVCDDKLEFSLASLPEDHREIVSDLVDDSLSEDFLVIQNQFNLIVTLLDTME
jgi:hypothetical protein